LGLLAEDIGVMKEDNPLVRDLGQLLIRITEARNEAVLWAVCGRFSALRGKNDAELDCLQKEMRLLQTATCCENEIEFRRLANASVRLVDALLRHGDVKIMKSNRLTLKRIIKMAEEQMQGVDVYEKMKGKVEELEASVAASSGR
jgi:hypothetical protein